MNNNLTVEYINSKLNFEGHGSSSMVFTSIEKDNLLYELKELVRKSTNILRIREIKVILNRYLKMTDSDIEKQFSIRDNRDYYNQAVA